MPETYRIPPDLVVCFQGGPVAERTARGTPMAITHDTLAVLTACRDGSAAADVTARLASGGYDTTEEQVSVALGALAEAGLQCAEDDDGELAVPASRSTGMPPGVMADAARMSEREVVLDSMRCLLMAWRCSADDEGRTRRRRGSAKPPTS